VLLSEIQGERDAAVSARKILDALAAQHCIEQLGVQITCSIGISLFPADGSSAGALLRHADSAMYQAKQAGRNHYRFFHDSVEVHADGDR
jgi:diguanylate cyclase (GGDEF)-like protein